MQWPCADIRQCTSELQDLMGVKRICLKLLRFPSVFASPLLSSLLCCSARPAHAAMSALQQYAWSDLVSYPTSIALLSCVTVATYRPNVCCVLLCAAYLTCDCLNGLAAAGPDKLSRTTGSLAANNHVPRGGVCALDMMRMHPHTPDACSSDKCCRNHGARFRCILLASQ